MCGLTLLWVCVPRARYFVDGLAKLRGGAELESGSLQEYWARDNEA